MCLPLFLIVLLEVKQRFKHGGVDHFCMAYFIGFESF